MSDPERKLSPPKPATPRKRPAKASTGQPARSSAAEPASAPPRLANAEPPADEPAPPVAPEPVAMAPAEGARPVVEGPPATLRLTESLDLLTDVLAGVRQRGGTPTAAGLKVVMQRQSEGAFNETALGFRNFRSFLSLAQSAGLISLSEHAGDVLVLPASAVPPPPTDDQPPRPPVEHSDPEDRTTSRGAASAVAVPAGAKVRADLWSATLDFDDSATYVYDRRGDRAWRIPSSRAPDESEAEAVLRRRLDETPGDFLPTPRVTVQEQLGWMAAFAADLDATWSNRLAEALQQERPLTAFAAAVRADADIHRAWRGTLLRAIVGRLEQWSAEHGLDIDLFQRSRTSRPPATATAAESRSAGTAPRPGGARGPEDEIRSRIVAALERMPLADLLRLPVPAELLLRP